MKKRSLPIIVACLACALPLCVSGQEAETVLHPEWGPLESGLFLSACAGYAGTGVCTAYVVLPLLMDLFWYSAAPSTADVFASRLGQSFAAHLPDNAMVLVWDAVCLSGAVVCDVVLHQRLKKASAREGDEGRTDVSVMGVLIGRM